MYEYLSQLHRHTVFTKDDVVAITGCPQRAAALLLNYQSRHLIAKVRRNLYCVLNLATGSPEATKAQLATAISPTAAVAYHSALEYHGFAHQLFYEMTVVSDTRFTPFEFDGIRYAYFRSPFPDGIVSPAYDNQIRVTCLERTVIDCIDRIDLCGGIEELLLCLSSIPHLSTDLLLHYLQAYNKIALYKKAGYLLSLFSGSLSLNEDFFSLCRHHSDRSITMLTTLEPCPKYISQWHLYVPQNIANIIYSTPHDDI